MKKHLLTALLLGLCAGAASAAEWFEGGTLHRAAVMHWHEASYENRLATSADFLAAVRGARDFTELKLRAAALERCITDVSKAEDAQQEPVAAVGSFCIIELGYNP